MDSNYWYRVRVLLGLREVHSSRGDICRPGRHLRMRTKPFAIIAVRACVERRLAAHDALDGVTSRTLREPARDTAVRSLFKPSFPGRLEPTAGSVSPILSKRSARSNSSSWISAIGVCRANCRTFSAISRQCRAVILRSSLNATSPRPKRPRMYGAFRSFDIAMPANSRVLRISLRYLTGF